MMECQNGGISNKEGEKKLKKRQRRRQGKKERRFEGGPEVIKTEEKINKYLAGNPSTVGRKAYW